MRQPVLVTISVLVAWYFSFLIIFIIPLDVSSTFYSSICSNSTPSSGDVPTTTTSTTPASTTMTATTTALHSLTRRAVVSSPCSNPPSSLLPEGVLLSLWRVVYWTSQLLTWLVLPLMQSFSQAGEFTFLGKLRSSLWDNAIYYTSYLFIAVTLVVYIALQPGLHLTWGKTKAIAAAASNTWGLTLLVLMLGYGLVEVPRNLWNSSKKGHNLSLAYFKVTLATAHYTSAPYPHSPTPGEQAVGGEE